MHKHNPKHNLQMTEPRKEDIAILAHSFFESEGGRDGNDIEHWLRAEDQLSIGLISEKKARQFASRKQATQKRPNIEGSPVRPPRG